ncbi:MAG: ABC transporter permease [Candidatus Altarchaeaceae archaeon]
MKPDKLTILFGILGALILLFISIPLLNLILSSAFNTEIFIKYLTDKEVLNSVFLSFFCAFLATLIAFIFGVPLAYLLARKDFFGKSVIEGIIDVPVVVPHTVAGVALLAVFASHGLIGQFLPIKFVNAIPGIVIAMLFVSIPLIINYSREGFESVDVKLENTARTLGANQFYVFLKISFPLAFRNIFVGSIMTWARSVSEFGAVIMIAHYPIIATTMIYEKFLTKDLYAVQAIAAILLIFCLIVFVILRLMIRKKKE